MAYHEAGHAVVACLVGRPFEYVTIAPSDDTLGHVRYGLPSSVLDVEARDRLTERAIGRTVLTALAGPEAEASFAGRYSHVGAAGDWEAATSIAFIRCGSTEEVSAYLRWMELRARGLLRAHWHRVGARGSLLREPTISSRRARAIAGFGTSDARSRPGSRRRACPRSPSRR